MPDYELFNNLKTMLDISLTDTSMDAKLLLIISNAKARLSVLLGGITPPESLDHIVLEASVSRFNRIGSEGMSAHSVEGESLTFDDGDFGPFKDEIEAYLESQKDSKRGRLRFL